MVLVSLGLLGKGLEDEVAGGLGFEPRQSESESEGLPLADPPIAGNGRVFSGGAGFAQGR